MHKTFLNSEEVSVIKGSDAVIKKIGGFPSMENGSLIKCKTKNTKNSRIDIELTFDITGWLKTLDYYKNEDPCYKHKKFRKRNIKMKFKNCDSIIINGSMNNIGEIKFGGVKQLNQKYRFQDNVPEEVKIIEKPYVCFYISNGLDFLITFRPETIISAKLC